jgi:molybdopterin-guanine dinucleotide biosynthesis protein A
VDGRDQPLCAKWAAADLARAPALFEAGERSLRPLLDGARRVGPANWGLVADARAFADVDTPADLARLGLV